MPLYEFTCPKCGRLYEYIVKLDKLDTEIKCPNCGEPLKREVSFVKVIKIERNW